MSATETLQTDLRILCDRCGKDCGDGYTERVYNTDPQTGYQDSETVCSRCDSEERGLCLVCLKEVVGFGEPCKACRLEEARSQRNIMASMGWGSERHKNHQKFVETEKLIKELNAYMPEGD